MRLFLIRKLLPLLLCLLPCVGALLIVAATPRSALEFYWQAIQHGYLDWIILSLGTAFFLVQIYLAYRALQWEERHFYLGGDPLLQRFQQAADWFPLLGLFGTVASILQTFAAIGAQASVPQREIIRLYAPALTATASGLLMAFLNLLPLWLVATGRGLIQSLAMEPAATTKGA